MTDTNTYQAQANELSQKLWAIANDLRGQMDASEFKNYILGVIFYRYLSERTEMYMTDLLKNDDGITYEEAFADDEYRPVVEEWSLSKLGYVIKPENLFRNLIRKITKFENDADKFNVEDFEKDESHFAVWMRRMKFFMYLQFPFADLLIIKGI